MLTKSFEDYMETRKYKKCPYCGEMIMAKAKKCRYCGSWIQGDERHMMRCPSCGEMIDKTIVTCPYCGERVKNSQPQYNENLSSNDNSKDNYEIENIIADDSQNEQQDTIDTSEFTSMENDEDKEFIEIKNYVHCDSIIIIKYDNIVPYGGIFYAMSEFKRTGLDKLVDGRLNVRCANYGYQYSDIMLALFCIYLCGGDHIEDITTILNKYLSTAPGARIPSSDTIARGLSYVP
jgi:predicted RNA-binding Zn-ribbon protein involved in translation (DUF1610 family)